MAADSCHPIPRARKVFYEASLDATTYDEERRGLFSEEVVRKIVPVRLSIGASSSRVVIVDEYGRVARTPHSLPELSRDEAEVIQALSAGWFMSSRPAQQRAS